MKKQHIAIVGIIIIGIVLSRYLLTRIEKESEITTRQSRVMYLKDHADIREEPDYSSPVLYTLSRGAAILIVEYNDEWKQLKSGGFVSVEVLSDKIIINN